MKKEKQLRDKAEQHILRGEYQEAIITYLEILKDIRPNTIKANGYLSAIEDCDYFLCTKNT